jgi:hypothetical protein
MNNSKLLQQVPEPNGADLIEAQRDLAKLLDGMSREDEFGDIINLLADMVRDGTLVFHWDAVDGQPIRIWYAQRAKRYCDRPVSLLNETSAAVAELFISGEVVFAIFPFSPQAIQWRRNVHQNRTWPTGSGGVVN